MHSLAQLFQGERLSDDAVNELGRRFLAFRHAARQKSDGNLRVSGLDRARHLHPIVVTESDVEEDERDALGVHEPLDVRPRSGLEHGVALELEVDAAEQPHRLVVVCDEHAPVPRGRHRGAL